LGREKMQKMSLTKNREPSKKPKIPVGKGIIDT